MNWRPISERPRIRKPLLMRGPSGYIEPHHECLVSGYYDPEYRPLNPWLDFSGEAVTDSTGIEPTHWIYLDEIV